MTCRHKRLRPNDTAWLNCKREGIPDHARVTVLAYDTTAHTYRVRIEEGPQEGSEHELPHWEVVRWEFEIKGRWFDESHPIALQAIADALPALRAKPVPLAIERDIAEVIANDERILARHVGAMGGGHPKRSTPGKSEGYPISSSPA